MPKYEAHLSFEFEHKPTILTPEEDIRDYIEWHLVQNVGVGAEMAMLIVDEIKEVD